MRVPINDSLRQYQALADRLEEAICRVARSGRYIMGPEHAAFETDFATFAQRRHAVAVANGTDALELALRMVGCGPGSEVVTVANAGMYTTTACLLVGATPVFADIDAETLCMSAASLAAALSSRTRAVVVTHLYGKMADVAAIRRAIAGRDIAVVEDCAQAHGASLDGKRAGSFFDIGCYSFYPTKNLGAMGDGGALVADDDTLAARGRQLRQYGWDEKYHAVALGGRNSRMDEMQAAVLRVKLPFLERWNAARRVIVTRYRAAVAGTEIVIPHCPASDFVAHLCVARHPERERLRDRLAGEGVDTAIHYPVPDHLQPVAKDFAWRAGSLVETERAAREIFSLPCFAEMTEAEVDHVCDVLQQSA